MARPIITADRRRDCLPTAKNLSTSGDSFVGAVYFNGYYLRCGHFSLTVDYLLIPAAGYLCQRIIEFAQCRLCDRLHQSDRGHREFIERTDGVDEQHFAACMHHQPDGLCPVAFRP